MATSLFEDPGLRKLLFGQVKEKQVKPFSGGNEFWILLFQMEDKLNGKDIIFFMIWELHIAHKYALCQSFVVHLYA